MTAGMPIRVTLPDETIANDAERDRLIGLLGLNSAAALPAALAQLAGAALDEYKTMLLGQGMPSRADEIRQLRLFFLIKHRFAAPPRIPEEAEVSSMFQLTPSRSRNLIQAVLARFRFQLETEVTSTLQSVMAHNRHDGAAGVYTLEIQSDFVVEEMNRIIAREGPRNDPVAKVRNTARTFEIADDTWAVLENHLARAAAGP
jgi:hypothetical protein